MKTEQISSSSNKTPQNDIDSVIEQNATKHIDQSEIDDLEFEEINIYENIKDSLEIETKKIYINYKEDNQSHKMFHNLYLIAINESGRNKKVLIHWLQVANLFEINPLAFKRNFLNNIKYPLKKCISKYKLNEQNKNLFEFIEKKLNVSLKDYGDSKETTLILKDCLNEICKFIFNQSYSQHFKELLKQI